MSDRVRMTVSGERDIRQTIERAVQDMPALPDVISKILQETEREYASSNDLEKLLGSDPALAAKTLRVVNSAYYGLPQQVSCLSQAVVILGLQQIRNLVLSISALSIMKAKTARQREIQRQIWTHSFATASGANIVAKKKRLEPGDCELVFVGGLLHDLGKLFLFSNFTDTYQEVLHYAETKGVSVCEAEDLLLGINHAELGKELGRFWNFPERVVELIGPHYGPFEGEPQPMIFCIHVADCLSANLYTEGKKQRLIDVDVEEWLGCNEAEVRWLSDQIAIKVAAANEFFGLIAA
jgi:putative nucleotidyltransferase with HDIG domain